MSTSAQALVYSPLDHSTSQIRLIHLQPRLSPDDQDIRCSLSLANLEDENCTYEALSYEWGPPTDTPMYIRLDDCRFAVRPNLWSALWHLRDDGEEGSARILWIDALCIDQNNEGERNHQVRQMGTIYQLATQVVAWIGPIMPPQTSGPASLQVASVVQGAFEFVEHLYGTITTRRDYDDAQAVWRGFSWPDLRNSQSPIRNDDHRWEMLHQVLHMTYWTRLWITQELVLAKDVTIQFGKSSLSFLALEHVLGQSLRWDLSLKWGRTRAAYIDREVRAFLNNSPAATSLGGTTAFKVAQQRFERIPAPDYQLNRRATSNYQSNTILNLCYKYRQAFCLDPSDKIFALLGMSQPCCQQAIPIEYGELPLHLCYTALTHQLRDHDSHFLKFTESTPDGKAELFNIIKAIFDLFEDSSIATGFPTEDLFTNSCTYGSVAKLIGRNVGNIALEWNDSTQVEKQFIVDSDRSEGICTRESSGIKIGDSVFALNSNDVLILRPSSPPRRIQLVGKGSLRNALPLYNASGKMPDLDFLFLDIKSLRTLCRVSGPDAKYLLVGIACFTCSILSDLEVSGVTNRMGARQAEMYF
ncbi:HET-domain-containing protein [Cadophora sp. DSE1049]|nr:HET-domain-containing protein [Cadophora sp. DSE1049]